MSGRNYRAALAARAEEIAETKARLLLNIKPLLDGLRRTKTLAVNARRGKESSYASRRQGRSLQ